MLKNISARESYVYNKFVLGLHENTFSGFMFKYAKDTARKIHGIAK
jgi:hypothetical protein